jgi:pyruvate/2-oxoglutarate dehydrogenase complex dihydrolipoamide dehydrogenase (E3) component
VANTGGINLTAAGVLLDHRGFVKVDNYLRTSVLHTFGAGDVTGRLMLAQPAIQGASRLQRLARADDGARRGRKYRCVICGSGVGKRQTDGSKGP